MTKKKIRLGFIGASAKSTGGWAAKSHLPALLASADVELTAVCTTKRETAEAARKAFGAKLAFDDYREMITSPEIDAVAVVIRVPSHYEPTKAAIVAGKHVYTEWPLGRNTAEAEEMTELARAKGVMTAVGLQSRVSPPLLYMKHLIDTGFVGEVIACHANCLRDGPLARPSSSTWQRDASLGANAFTIFYGHISDALRFVVGDFSRVSAMVSTQVKQWLETDTKKLVDVTSPDNIMVNGKLASGAAASVHVAGVPWAGGGVRLLVYGREGTLVATGDVSTQRGPMLRLQGARHSNELKDMQFPDRFLRVPPDFPAGDPFNVGQMYSLFAEAIRTGQTPKELPTFETAVGLHRFLDTVKESSDTGRELPVS